jgi:putative cell wall-binding protein
VKNVYIVGGTSAVSAAVEAALKATSATKCTGVNAINSTNPVPGQKIQVVRVSGPTRYATNRAVVNLGSGIFDGNSNMFQLEFLQPYKHTAIVATGTAFADALAAGAAVYDGCPLILTDGTSLSPEAALTLTDNDITQVIIIGGTSAVSDAVKAQIAALGIQAERISGANRYATATAFADFLAKGPAVAAVAGAFDGGFDWGPATHVMLASGTNFADALSGGPLAWDWAAPIILTQPTVLSADSQAWLVAHKVDLTGVTALGLGSAVSTSVLNAASAAIS